ncbi:MAG: N-acetylmuramoyl-L-alanine amidase [Muribaculaceae bacterium]|nr:N-acetylmuramoyl-L-alanine amidase [Muribaculaceae bacterium]
MITIVLDPGHGGKDFGAVENGAKEKEINLAVAKKLRRLIEKGLKGKVDVVMTRTTDVYLTLQQRADIANDADGDLFMSIHVNSVDKKSPGRQTVKGSSVYVLGLHKDQDNMKVAMRENSVIELESDYKEKYSGFDPSKDESYIIFEMAQKRNLGESIRVASDAQNALVNRAGRANRGVRQAGFWVLWATSMPAVLVELDFICNPQSVKYMTSEEGEDELAESLFISIKKFVERRN